jgi:hypothetical protein
VNSSMNQQANRAAFPDWPRKHGNSTTQIDGTLAGFRQGSRQCRAVGFRSRRHEGRRKRFGSRVRGMRLP